MNNSPIELLSDEKIALISPSPVMVKFDKKTVNEAFDSLILTNQRVVFTKGDGLVEHVADARLIESLLTQKIPQELSDGMLTFVSGASRVKGGSLFNSWKGVELEIGVINFGSRIIDVLGKAQFRLHDASDTEAFVTNLESRTLTICMVLQGARFQPDGSLA